MKKHGKDKDKKVGMRDGIYEQPYFLPVHKPRRSKRDGQPNNPNHPLRRNATN